MALFRVFLLLFNVAVVTFLIFEMIRVVREPMDTSKKVLILAGGCLLLLAPFGMFLRFFAPAVQYFFVYPVAIALFLYLAKKL
jgi:hypothetical protein